MLVALDTNMLTLFLKPEVPPPHDPTTGAPVERAAERVNFLIEQLAKDRSRILIPATVWAEFLVVADDSGAAFAAQIEKKSVFDIVPFDKIAAVEAAIDQRNAIKAGNKKLTFDGTRQCLKADRQIAAIAKTRGVDVLYATDKDMVNIGAAMGVHVVPLWHLQLPPDPPPTTPFLNGLDVASDASGSAPPSAQSPDDEKG